MEAVVIVTVLALLQYVYFGLEVGGVRAKTGIKAPAMSGDETFERYNRVHQNTLEQLVLLIPVLWIYAHHVNPLWGAGLAAVYIIGRFIYRSSYIQDPSSRSVGFTLSFLPAMIMAIWVLVKAVMSYF